MANTDPMKVGIWQHCRCPKCTTPTNDTPTALPVRINATPLILQGVNEVQVRVDNMAVYRCQDCGFEFWELHTGVEQETVLEDAMVRTGAMAFRLEWELTDAPPNQRTEPCDWFEVTAVALEGESSRG